MGKKRREKESIAGNKLPHYQHHAPPKKKRHCDDFNNMTKKEFCLLSDAAQGYFCFLENTSTTFHFLLYFIFIKILNYLSTNLIITKKSRCNKKKPCKSI